MGKMVAFVGGGWQGEAREFFGPLERRICVGEPPKYIGGNQYDPYVSHVEHYDHKLIFIDSKPYYLHECLWDEWERANNAADDLAEIFLVPRETPNSIRMRDEIESTKRREMKDRIETSKHNFILACIAKHEFMDEIGVEDSGIYALINKEDMCWRSFTNNKKILEGYEGEPPILKAVRNV